MLETTRETLASVLNRNTTPGEVAAIALAEETDLGPLLAAAGR